MKNVDFVVFTKFSSLKCGVKKSKCIIHTRKMFFEKQNMKEFGGLTWRKRAEKADFKLICAKMVKFGQFTPKFFHLVLKENTKRIIHTCMFPVKTKYDTW